MCYFFRWPILEARAEIIQILGSIFWEIWTHKYNFLRPFCGPLEPENIFQKWIINIVDIYRPFALLKITWFNFPIEFLILDHCVAGVALVNPFKWWGFRLVSCQKHQWGEASQSRFLQQHPFEISAADGMRL